MLYHSTRSLTDPVSGARAVLKGLAPDGGLYIPQSIPSFDWQQCLQGDFYTMATRILSAFLGDTPQTSEFCRNPKPLPIGKSFGFPNFVLPQQFRTLVL